MFSNYTVDRDLVKSAVREADLNWRWWAEDFEHAGSFASMPVFQTYPRFRGFGADYSVFRGLAARDLDRLRSWFREQPDPTSFADLFRNFSAESPGQKRISLISKLLTLWRPQDYAMWDSLARVGLKRLHGSQRGHCYNGNEPSSYEVFRKDFFDLFSIVESDLATGFESIEMGRNSADFAPRILDNYLMLKGQVDQS